MRPSAPRSTPSRRSCCTGRATPRSPFRSCCSRCGPRWRPSPGPGRACSPSQEATLTVVGSAAVASYVLAVGSPAHALLFSAHEGAAQAPLALHIARDTVMALPAGVVISAAVVRLRDRRSAPTRHADAAAGDANLRLTRGRIMSRRASRAASGCSSRSSRVRTAVGDSASPAATPFVLPAAALPPAAVPVLERPRRTCTRSTPASPSPGSSPTGPLTRIWAYDGHSPGPTILAEAGRTAEVTFHNGLVGEREPDGAPVELTTHLHGGHQAPVDDGWATDARNLGFTALIPPNESRTYHFPNVKDIGAGKAENGKPLWYHDHLMDLTGFNVYQGLAGAYLHPLGRGGPPQPSRHGGRRHGEPRLRRRGHPAALSGPPLQRRPLAAVPPRGQGRARRPLPTSTAPSSRSSKSGDASTASASTTAQEPPLVQPRAEHRAAVRPGRQQGRPPPCAGRPQAVAHRAPPSAPTSSSTSPTPRAPLTSSRCRPGSTRPTSQCRCCASASPTAPRPTRARSRPSCARSSRSAQRRSGGPSASSAAAANGSSTARRSIPTAPAFQVKRNTIEE